MAELLLLLGLPFRAFARRCCLPDHRKYYVIRSRPRHPSDVKAFPAAAAAFLIRVGKRKAGR